MEMIIIMAQPATYSPNMSFVQSKPVVLSDRWANNVWENRKSKEGHVLFASSETASQMRL